MNKESKKTISKTVKIVIGSIIGGIGIYYLWKYFTKQKENVSNFVKEYITKIKKEIQKNPFWINDTELLCHINFIINEIADQIFKQNYSENLNKRRNTFEEEDKWKEMLSEDKKIIKEIKEEIINEYLIQNFDLDVREVSSALNDNLINLPENKKFEKYIPFEEDILSEILKNKTTSDIDDAYFFSTYKQIEYNNIIESNENKFGESTEYITLKDKFKDEFFNKYGFECKYISDLMKIKEGEKVTQFNSLVNRILY